MTLRHALAALCLVALLPPRQAAGQTILEASGSIVGTVQDATGAVLPGVTVTAASAALMGPQVAVTNADGRYRLAALPPGDYTLSFALPGFTTLRHDAVRVGLGFTATIDVALTVATLPDRVSVTSRATLDRHATGLSFTFDQRQLASLPSSRSMFGLITLTPSIEVVQMEVGGSGGAAGGPYGAYGTRGANRPMLEGISLTGIAPTGFTLDFGSFEEVSVLTGAHGPEWPTPGVHVQIISKSGGNQFRATLYADHENRRWQGFNVDAAQIARGAQSGDGLAPREANRKWHYRDVNADAGGFVVRDRLWWYASSRDQQVSSRLVNFPVKPHRTDLTNVSGKSTYRLTPSNTLVGFVQAGWNHQPNRLDPFGPAGGGLAAATAVNESEGSTADQHAVGWVWKAEWSSVLGERLSLDVRVGQFGADQEWTPRSTLPRFEDVVTLKVTGGNRDWHRGVRRNQLSGTLNYFDQGWMGSHHVRVGLEAARGLETETWREAYPGGVLHVWQQGSPAEVYIFKTPSLSQSGLWSYSVYAGDSVRIHDRFTLNAGARFDRYRVFLPAQEHPAGISTARRFAAVDNVIDWNVIVPRLGAAYDLTGDGKTLAKLSVGQYRLPPGVAFGFSVNPNSNEWWTRHTWTDLDGDGVWSPGEEGRARGGRGGIALESIDPALELPIVNEVAAWLERELPGDISFRSGAVWRRQHQNFTRQNANRPFDAFTVPVDVPDPGPDGVTGTADDGAVLRGYNLRPEFLELPLPAVNIVRNVPGAESEAWTWEIGAARRLSGRWSLGAGFAITWNYDHAAAYAGQTIRNNAFPLTPNDLINTGQGGRHEFTTWTFKVHGTFEAPGGIRITPVLRHQSGQPFGRTFVTTAFNYGIVRVLAEPVGTRRTDNITLTDIRAEKTIRLRRDWRVAGFVDVFNTLNANPEQSVIWTSGRSFLQPISIVPPRIARIGVRLDW